MKINETQLYAALNEFIDTEIMPLSAGMPLPKQFVFGWKIGIIRRKVETLVKNYLNKGEIKMLGKARGSKMGNNLLVQQIEKAGGVDFSMPVLLGYTGLSDSLLCKYIEDSKHIWECGTESLCSELMGSVIGTHAGHGAVAVAFFRKTK